MVDVKKISYTRMYAWRNDILKINEIMLYAFVMYVLWIVNVMRLLQRVFA